MSSNSEEYTREEIWTLFGSEYGYPECCVSEFCLRAPGRPRFGVKTTLDQTRAIAAFAACGREGYLPCRECATELVQNINSLVCAKLLSTLNMTERAHNVENGEDCDEIAVVSIGVSVDE